MIQTCSNSCKWKFAFLFCKVHRYSHPCSVDWIGDYLSEKCCYDWDE